MKCAARIMLFLVIATLLACGRSKVEPAKTIEALTETAPVVDAASAVFKAADWDVERDWSWPAEAMTLLGNRDYAGLDSLADRCRAAGHDTDGAWSMRQFYDVLSTPGVADEAGWNTLIERLEEWRKKSPRSVPARVALGNVVVSYAWNARGSGWGSSVTDEGRKLMAERLTRARSVLEEAAALDSSLPDAYDFLGGVALGQGWSLDDREKLFRKATAIEPDDYGTYGAYAYFLLPRWHGKENDWHDFAKRTARERGDTLGAEMYARIVWFAWGYGEKVFEQKIVDWSLMRSGFRVMMQRWPKSRWNLNAFAFFACVNGDEATARELLPQINNKPIMNVWGDRDYFNRCLAWIGTGRATARTPEHTSETP